MRATLRVSLGFVFLAIAAAAGAQQIQFAEPVELAVDGAAAQFDAYGRRFSLTLSDNERVFSKLSSQRKQQLRGYRLLRGALDGQPGSWVRLTESADGVEGAIWDGRELYAVTTYRQIAGYLTTPMSAAPDDTVVYRLSDARDLLPRDFCALHAKTAGMSKQTALDQYHAMVADMQGLVEAKITRQIEISLLADSDFAAGQSPDPNAAMIARLNIVEGIFSEQVGLLIQATDVRVMDAKDDPFAATQGSTLLEQLGKYRASTAAVRARGLAHLMTGKNLDGTTAGIAYVDSVCTADRAVSVSEQTHGATISALIMAHEIGHNLGAPHDGEAGACASVSGGFIMSPSVSGFSTFSQCSIDVMHAVLETASCVTPADYADAALAATSNVSAEGGLPFALPFVVKSSGTSMATDVAFTLSVPESAGVSLESASAEGGSCTASGVIANCSFGDLPAGEQRTVNVNARGMLAGVVTAKARVSAVNDRLTSNNTREVAINLRSGIDAAVALSTDLTEVMLGAPLQVYADVRSLRTLPVRNAVLALNLNQAVLSASMPGATCAVNGSSVICNLAELPAGSERRLTVQAQTSTPGPLFAVGNISASGDGDLTNNSGSARGWVQADKDIELTAGPGTVELGIGSSYEVPLLVSSRGLGATGDVTLQVSIPSTAIVIESIDAEGAPCSTPEGGSFKCMLGRIAPGATALVRLRLQGSRAATVNLSAVADAADDGYAANNSASVQLRLDNAVDLGLLLASGGSGVEDRDIEGQISVSSGGRQSAIGATLDVELHEAGVLRQVSIHNGADCELLSRRLARCALPVLARGALLYVDYTAQFADPGTYEVEFRVQTPGDTAAGNDSLTRPILVRPHNDIALSGELDLTRMLVGSARETRFSVTTGERALASARFVARHYHPGVRVKAIRADTGACAVDEEIGGVCDFTNLEAGSTHFVVVSWQAEGSLDTDASVSVSTTGDVAMSNNSVNGRVEVFAATDLELRVGAAASGATGQALDFPPISIVNGSAKALETRLEIMLPSGVSLVAVSAANAICSGTTVLSCDFGALEPNSISTVNVSVRASTRGSYQSTLKLSALNDTNPANDSRQVAFEISGSTGVATATRSGGGGGGSLEWLSLLLLAALACRKWGQAPFAGKRGRTCAGAGPALPSKAGIGSTARW